MAQNSVWVANVESLTEPLARGFVGLYPHATRVSFHVKKSEAITSLGRTKAGKFFAPLRTVREIFFVSLDGITLDLNVALHFAACCLGTVSITFVGFKFIVNGGSSVNLYAQWWSPTVLFRDCTLESSQYTLEQAELGTLIAVLNKRKAAPHPSVADVVPIEVPPSAPWGDPSGARAVRVLGALPRTDWATFRVSFPRVMKVSVPPALATAGFFQHVRDVAEIEIRGNEVDHYSLETLLNSAAQSVGVGLVRFTGCDRWTREGSINAIVEKYLTSERRFAGFIALDTDIDKMWADRLLKLRHASEPQFPSAAALAEEAEAREAAKRLRAMASAKVETEEESAAKALLGMRLEE